MVPSIRQLFIFIICFAVNFSLAAPSAALTVLLPSDDHKTSGSKAWLIVDGSAEVKATLDGEPVEIVRRVENTVHIRLSGIKLKGSDVVVSDGNERVSMHILGAAVDADSFHGKKPDQCLDCHDIDQNACGDCHKWGESKHKQAIGDGCGRCHSGPGFKAKNVAEACESCHDAFAGGKHPRLRHAVSAPNDPLQPGRRFDCASCHDPHEPLCLGCMKKSEQRKWCMRCHSKN